MDPRAEAVVQTLRATAPRSRFHASAIRKAVKDAMVAGKQPKNKVKRAISKIQSMVNAASKVKDVRLMGADEAMGAAQPIGPVDCEVCCDDDGSPTLKCENPKCTFGGACVACYRRWSVKKLDCMGCGAPFSKESMIRSGVTVDESEDLFSAHITEEDTAGWEPPVMEMVRRATESKKSAVLAGDLMHQYGPMLAAAYVSDPENVPNLLKIVKSFRRASNIHVRLTRRHFKVALTLPLWRLKSSEKSRRFPCSLDGCSGSFTVDKPECCTCCVTHCPDCLGWSTENHECDPDANASVRHIMETTQSCSGCLALVHKTDGCNAMFCVRCYAGFDYVTGEPVERMVEIPHIDSVPQEHR